ncbi:phosphate acetyltransferase [Oleiphilus sp. HI0081]|nr:MULTISPECIES: phosphate acetyltransferase [unclassified Oleiphilus]KZY79547.1 phosphate acetyltransferase [Oleiphilus sp. HI0069]KZY84580.1 phosphate acetyltransferase [Oleiphilus sp. HI0068]KZZ21265.1 phosphate acetyltransferase [Oleiphilus sp. HI0081]KZY29510.1 phosphate acetyltransferase [Oleiphilus sp. HI0043]KZY60573.1 phosphate acetyltransferase [Oleiphilus sp. HI0061]
MSKSFFIAPTAKNAGLTSVSLGLLRALDQIGVRVGFFKPITQITQSHPDHSVHFANAINHIDSPKPIPLKTAQDYLTRGDKDLLMEEVIENFHKIKKLYDVIIIEGIVPTTDEAHTSVLNKEMANSLDAEIILLVPMTSLPSNCSVDTFDDHLKTSLSLFSSIKAGVIGCILNKVGCAQNAKQLHDDAISLTEATEVENCQQLLSTSTLIEASTVLSESFHSIGQIPLVPALQAPRVFDIANELQMKVVPGTGNEEILRTRRVTRIAICARSVSNLISALTPGCLLVTPGDRSDVLLAAGMAVQNGLPLAGIVLTGNYQPDESILDFCRPALQNGLPLLSTHHDTFETAVALSKLENKVPLDDLNRMDEVMTTVADHLDIDWLKLHCDKERATRLSPPAFRYQLSENARSAAKTIVLPEGNEPRTICAAIACHERELAQCILIGKPDEIKAVASAQGVTLSSDIQIVDPDEARERYVIPMTEIRKHKGVSHQMARAMLEDNVVLATMMVALDEVDGLVSGAVHTTANTVRPALQLIKTNDCAKVVSSVFFMCLPDQVLVYGDCAINPDPNAEQLADIAIQSADSAKAFGIDPKVAMISYSTGVSGTGADVDKVREATEIAKNLRPDLVIDGPLQYDAAAIESVAKKKAPNSPVAGQATVFIFPDLNTGNTTYKAVQRSANVISIGPMLQGLRKPVNDLSRGALIEDIVFTIALTAVQACQSEQKGD